MSKKYRHILSLGFTVVSETEDVDDITPFQIQEAIQQRLSWFVEDDTWSVVDKDILGYGAADRVGDLAFGHCDTEEFDYSEPGRPTEAKADKFDIPTAGD